MSKNAKTSSKSIERNINRYKSDTIIDELVDEEDKASFSKSKKSIKESIIKDDKDNMDNNKNNVIKEDDKENVKIINTINETSKIHNEVSNTNKSQDNNKTNLKDILQSIEITSLNTSGTKLEEYLLTNSIPQSFNLIFTELIIKKINPSNYFAYTASRLQELNKTNGKYFNKYYK